MKGSVERMTKKAYVIERLPVGMELSEIDRVALYGSLEVRLTEETEDDERKE